MVKRFLAFILLLLVSGFSLAQDMPPLPPDSSVSSGASSSAASSAPALPALPASASSAPAAPAASTDQSMPPLPDSSTAPASSPAASTPPLPDQSQAATPAASTPPLPADQSQPSAASAPASTDNATPVAASEPASTPKPAVKSFVSTSSNKNRPNVIFGGWVKAKGGNATSRLSWTSQQVMNALDVHKYKVLDKAETGVYEGELNKGPQWRDMVFQVPKSKLEVHVFAKEEGKRVWLRVGPPEPPATDDRLEAGRDGMTFAQTQKMRAENLKVLSYLKKKFGRRLSPHYVVPSWEAAYRHSQATADE